MPSPTHLILRAAICLSTLCLSAGCSSSDARAQQALTDYQSAAAANNLPLARSALLRLVRAKDDIAEYWTELGRLDASTGSYGDAYYAFTRAYELNRTDPSVLRAVTELALRTGDIAMAKSYARELEIVSPGDPWVKLTDGWAAVGQQQFPQALAAADALLATNPVDFGATILKGRALIGLNRQDEAVALLTKQVQGQPTDVGSLQLLARIYLRRSDWPRTAEVARRIAVQSPADRDNLLLLVQAAFRAGNTGLARAASARLLQPNADPGVIASTLELWESYWPSPQRAVDARGLASGTPGLAQRMVYAAFLNRVGSPADAVRLSASAATLPVTAESAEANAVLGDAFSRLGKPAEAKSRLDAVLNYDPGNATALRARSELELKQGDAQKAVQDAEKLVTVVPTSAPARLLLAGSYAAAGNRRWAERTLWSAFQDIPADERIFAALEASKKGDKEATVELEQEFARQQDARLGRGIL